MSVSTTASRIAYTGNGSLVGPYSFPYYASSSADILVYVAGVLQSSGYTVSGSGSAWNVTFTTAPANLATIIIKRSTARTQTSDYVENDAIPAAVVEGDFDKGVAIDQELQTEVDRSIKLAVDDTPSSGNTTMPKLVANKLIGLDANKELKYYTPGGSIPGDASGVTFTQSGVGATEITVEAKLYETVSVKDFGAVGDGVTDDTVAIQAAAAHCQLSWSSNQKPLNLEFPSGRYLVSSTLDLTDMNIDMKPKSSILTTITTGSAVQIGCVSTDSVTKYQDDRNHGMFFVLEVE
ncbi:MAG TPA: glycosyl hydrolase family 28-related protein, partial [Candidatus Obscuribacterales bacterium]